MRIRNVTFLSRAACGLPPVSAATRVDPRNLHEFVVHHTTGVNLGAPDPSEWWRNIARHHVHGQGWSDIGYSWGVARLADPSECVVLEGRGWDRIGAHTRGHNATGVGVALLGDGRDPEQVTAGVIDGFAMLAWFHAASGLYRPQRIISHRQVNATACPGDVLEAVAFSGWTGGTRPPAPPPAPVGPPWPGRLLRQPPMVRGDDVRTWQAQMVRRGWALAVDGIYGPQSERAARQFQRAHNLVVDGIVGPITWGATWSAPPV